MTVFNRWATGPGALAAFLQAIRLPSLLWCGVMAFYVTIEVASEADVLPRRLTGELTTILQASIILSVTITLAGMVETLITRVGESRAFGVPVTGLARAASRLTILAVGFLVLLSALGIHIAPILTALGVGGLAVALALQDTLSNLFAGMHLLADRPIRVGDYVRIADSVEGYVVDVGWRSTRVRMLQDNVVVVPNKRVAESIITNYDLPQSRLALGIRVSVDFDSDPDQVEAVLVDEATRAAVQHELRKRILRRVRAEGIGMPFPTRTNRASRGGWRLRSCAGARGPWRARRARPA